MSAISTSRRLSGKAAITSKHNWLIVTLLAATILLVPVAYRFVYRGQIYPGVRVAGVHLGGQTPGTALASLAAAGLRADAPVVLHAGASTWTLRPNELGLDFDSRATVGEAYAVGRRGPRPSAIGQMIGSRLGGRQVQPIIAFDDATARLALGRLAAEFDRPAQDASFAIDGTTVVPRAAEEGRYVNVAASLAALEALAADSKWPVGEVFLPVGIIQPALTDVGDTIEAARALLAAPIQLHHADRSWPLEPQDLGPMLKVARDDEKVRLDVDQERLGAWLGPVTQAVSRTAQLPRFHYDRATGALELIEPGQAQQRIDVPATAQRIVAATTDKEVALAVEVAPPAVSDSVAAEELGIRELVREETSRFSGSPGERVHNIQVAASKFDGRLLPPDAIVSFNDLVGDISAETGYEKTLIIMDGTTAEGVGGGVCQVSTTLFRTAFWSGLPILERQAHGYRVGYYEQGAPVGLDATVFSPAVDLKFKNDTGAWLLIETTANPKAATLTFRLYGTNPDRLVQLQGPLVSGSVPPPPARTEVDPSLAPGQRKKLEYARSGASVTVTRIIRQGDQETRETFHSHYRPTGELVAIAPPAASAAVPTPEVPPP